MSKQKDLPATYTQFYSENLGGYAMCKVQTFKLRPEITSDQFLKSFFVENSFFELPTQKDMDRDSTLTLKPSLNNVYDNWEVKVNQQIRKLQVRRVFSYSQVENTQIKRYRGIYDLFNQLVFVNEKSHKKP